MTFIWSIYNWLVQQLPPYLNKTKWNTWMQSLLAPLVASYSNFIAYLNYVIKITKVNGQTIILQNYLNDLYDPTLRRIVIITASDVLVPPYLYLKVENQPLYLYLRTEDQPVYLFTAAEYIVQYDFIVQAHVNSLTASQQIQIKASTNFFRLAGKIPRFQWDNGTQF